MGKDLFSKLLIIGKNKHQILFSSILYVVKIIEKINKCNALFLGLHLWLISALLPLNYVYANNVFDNLGDLTNIEREALEGLEISQNLQDLANDFSEDTKPVLTDNDREALKLLGYSDAEIDNLSLASLQDEGERDKFKSRLNSYANKKGSEIEGGVTKDLVPGLASSVIGLAFASLLGIVVGVRCYNQPSAITFAGTSGAWVALEVMIWKGFQIRMDDIQTLQNATKIPAYIEKKIERVKTIIGKLENDFKAKNLSDFEKYLEAKKPEIDELQAIAEEIRVHLKTAKDRQFGALRSLQESLELAAETSKKKSRNAKVAAIGYTVASGLAAAESFNIFTGGGTCVGVTNNDRTSKNDSLIAALLWKIIPSAQAGFASVGDLDKIGIPVGGGLAAAYLGFEQKFADKIYNSAVGRGVVFLAMAGIAYLASVKLKKAATFLEKQAKEMDIFVTSIEDKLSALDASFPAGAELIRELKQKLLPEIEEIVAEGLRAREGEIKTSIQNGLNDLVQDQIREGNISEEQVSELVNSEVQISQSDIQQTLNNLSTSDLSRLDTSDLSGRLTSYHNFIDFLIPNAMASNQSNPLKTPISCFKRTKRFVVADENCSCRAKKSCMQSRYPTKLSMKTKNEFGVFSYQLGALVSRSSNLIFNGQPGKGVQGFSKAGALTSKMNLNARKLLSRKVGKLIDNKVTARTIAGAFETIKPGLSDYFKGNSNNTQLNPKVSSQYIKARRKSLVSPRQERTALRTSLRERLRMAKSLGNKSLLGFSPKVETKNKDEVYNYSKEAIIRDSSKDIFQLIKKRYLIIQSQGRLEL